jgi:hypothetical protein
VLCARQLDQPPQLLFSAGTGLFFGGGFGGEAVEVAANICDVLKAAGVEGKLTPSEFLAVLLRATASEHWQQDLEELANRKLTASEELNDKRTTPILQDACRIAKPQKPQPVLVPHDAKEEGKLDSEDKIMPGNQAPYRTSPEPPAKTSPPDKMAQDKDVAPAKGKRSHGLSRAPTPKLVEVSSPTADVQGLVYTDNIEDVPTSQPTDDGILDQVCSVELDFLFDYDNLSIIPKLRAKFSKLLRCLLILSSNDDQQGDGESSSGGLLYERKKRIAQEAWKRRRILALLAQEGAQTSPSNDIGKSSPEEVGIVIDSGIGLSITID